MHSYTHTHTQTYIYTHAHSLTHSSQKELVHPSFHTRSIASPANCCSQTLGGRWQTSCSSQNCGPRGLPSFVPVPCPVCGRRVPSSSAALTPPSDGLKPTSNESAGNRPMKLIRRKTDARESELTDTAPRHTTPHALPHSNSLLPALVAACAP